MLFRQTLAALLIVAGSLNGQAAPSQPGNGSDDSGARPPVTKADVQIAKRARAILNSESVWNRLDTRDCPKGAKSFSLYCALETATEEVSGTFAHRGAAMQEARFVIEDISPKAKNYDHRLMGYNNDSGTTFTDIQNVLRLLEVRIAKRLEDEPSGGTPSTPKQTPLVTTADLRVVKRARELLDSPSKWNRADTQDCPANATALSIFCAFETAAKEVTGTFNDGAPSLREARSAVTAIAPERKYKARLTDFNNDTAVTFADVQKLFELVEERIATQLSSQAKDGK